MSFEVPAWEEKLWQELSAMSPREQFVKTGEWIPMITQRLLNELAATRRLAALEAVESDNLDATSFAELVGSRPTTISRLLEEARAIKRRALDPAA